MKFRVDWNRLDWLNGVGNIEYEADDKSDLGRRQDVCGVKKKGQNFFCPGNSKNLILDF